MSFHLRSQTHYGLLGIAEDASAAEIRQAFRRCAKQFHPDLNGSRHAREAFLSVNEAYHVLRDARRRAAYDETLDAEPMIAWADPEDFADEETEDESWHRTEAASWTRPARPQPAPVRPGLQRRHGLFAGLGLVGAMGAAALLVLAAPAPAGAPSERIAMGATAVPPEAPSPPNVNAQAAADPLSAGAPLIALADEPSASRPKPAKAEVPAAPKMDNWQATATHGQMPPVSALDVLAEVPLAAPVPAATLTAKQPPHPLAKRTAAALVSQVRKAAAAPVQVNRYYAAVQAAKARYAAIQAARARYAAAMAAKARMIRAQHHVVRNAVKRRYAAY